MQPKMNMGTWTAVGISIGAAVGSSSHNMGPCVAAGAVIGLLVGAIGLMTGGGTPR